MKEYDVLITDSTTKHALAAVRCLGEKGLKIMTCSNRFSPTKFSKYSQKDYKYKNRNFIQKLIHTLRENKVSVIMPIGYYSNILCAKHKKEIEKYSRVVVPPYNIIDIASDKEKSIKFIKKLGIPHPETYIIKKFSDINPIKIKNKMIIKSSKEMRGEKVEYIHNKNELIKKVKKRLRYGTQILQEYIDGFGCGFFALYHNGKLIASFQHRRIRQYPATGGISSCAESYYDKKLKNIGKKILKKLGWEGIAMLEFIFDKKTKKYKFIELNAKFWGSLDLAIASGVEFPYLYYLVSLNKYYKIPEYKSRVRFQWLLPEDTLRIKTAKYKGKAVSAYLSDLFNLNVKKDINYLFKDPLPTIIRIGATLYKFLFSK